MQRPFHHYAAAVALLASPGAAAAAVVSSPEFDTDSYIFIGTNNQTSSQITLGQSLHGTPGHPHFNFGVLEFDANSLSLGESYFLRLSSIEYVTGAPPDQVISPTGSSTVQVVALGAGWDDYQAAGSKPGWYDTNVQNPGVTIAGTMLFEDQGARYLDVSSVVEGWINDPSSNHGFALFSNLNGVELGASENANPALRPALVDAVPEPSPALLLGLAAATLGILRRRRRRRWEVAPA